MEVSGSGLGKRLHQLPHGHQMLLNAETSAGANRIFKQGIGLHGNTDAVFKFMGCSERVTQSAIFQRSGIVLFPVQFRARSQCSLSSPDCLRPGQQCHLNIPSGNPLGHFIYQFLWSIASKLPVDCIDGIGTKSPGYRAGWVVRSTKVMTQSWPIGRI